MDSILSDPLAQTYLKDYKQLITDDPSTFTRLKREFITDELCEHAVKTEPDLIAYLPLYMRNIGFFKKIDPKNYKPQMSYQEALKGNFFVFTSDPDTKFIPFETYLFKNETEVKTEDLIRGYPMVDQCCRRKIIHLLLLRNYKFEDDHLETEEKKRIFWNTIIYASLLGIGISPEKFRDEKAWITAVNLWSDINLPVTYQTEEFYEKVYRDKTLNLPYPSNERIDDCQMFP